MPFVHVKFPIQKLVILISRGTSRCAYVKTWAVALFSDRYTSTLYQDGVGSSTFLFIVQFFT
jgi:hypothetical protein